MLEQYDDIDHARALRLIQKDMEDQEASEARRPAGGYSKCPRCGYWAFDGYECHDCDYRVRGADPAPAQSDPEPFCEFTGPMGGGR